MAKTKVRLGKLLAKHLCTEYMRSFEMLGDQCYYPDKWETLG